VEWKALSVVQQRVLKFGGTIRDDEGRDLEEEKLKVPPLLRKVIVAPKMFVKKRAKAKDWRERMKQLKRVKERQEKLKQEKLREKLREEEEEEE